MALADQVLKRFPHDPRAYSLRADMFMGSRERASAERLLVRELALDSLAISAGDGSCTPCEVLWPLSQVRLARGDRAGAEQAARRWVAMQPDLLGTWRTLPATLPAVGASAEAATAGYHYLALSNETPALEADALMRAGDTTTAKALIDSLVSAGRQSSYPRDWLLHPHVRGLMFFAEGRLTDAERELHAAEWTARGWTRTNIELARMQLAERRPADAIATLRDAYTAPVDAMGRTCREASSIGGCRERSTRRGGGIAPPSMPPMRERRGKTLTTRRRSPRRACGDPKRQNGHPPCVNIF